MNNRNTLLFFIFLLIVTIAFFNVWNSKYHKSQLHEEISDIKKETLLQIQEPPNSVNSKIKKFPEMIIIGNGNSH